MNSESIYSVLCQQKPNNPHYIKRYVKFIKSIKVNSNFDYKEHHHILPKSIFPKYKNTKIFQWNGINLTPRQHFISHWMLAKCFGGKMWNAFHFMVYGKSSNQERTYKISSYMYETYKKNFCDAQRIRMTGDKNYMFGKLKEKSPNYGLTRSKETRKLMSNARNKSKKQIRCPHCLKIGESRSMVRWHFENCGTDSNKGSKNGNAKVVKIYNQYEELMFVCNGNLKDICNDNNLAFKSLSNSYKNGGSPIFQDPATKAKMIKMGRGFQIGWYAIAP